MVGVENLTALNHTKKLIGVAPECTDFDLDILTYMNMTMMTLFQLGVGSTIKFVSDSSNWADILPDDPASETLITYFYVKVKLLFDPPTNATLLNALKDSASELEFRINAHFDIGYSGSGGGGGGGTGEIDYDRIASKEDARLIIQMLQEIKERGAEIDYSRIASKEDVENAFTKLDDAMDELDDIIGESEGDSNA